MNADEILKDLDFVPSPMCVRRPDGNWVSFCECHTWYYVSSLENIAVAMLLEHLKLAHS